MTIVYTANRIHRQAKDVLLMMMLIGLLCAAPLFKVCASSPDVASETGKEIVSDVEKQWGIKVESIRITAAGHFVDFRYRVIDPDKAVRLMKRGDKAFIIEQASGRHMPVPVTKVGPLRGTGTIPMVGRIYTIIFTSGGGVVKKGSKVTVVIGEFRAENLVVE